MVRHGICRHSGSAIVSQHQLSARVTWKGQLESLGKDSQRRATMVSLLLPRSRYKEAYAAAMEMAHTALDCIASLGKHLAGLSLSWWVGGAATRQVFNAAQCRAQAHVITKQQAFMISRLLVGDGAVRHWPGPQTVCG
jgi:hypothetical protein